MCLKSELYCIVTIVWDIWNQNFLKTKLWKVGISDMSGFKELGFQTNSTVFRIFVSFSILPEGNQWIRAVPCLLDRVRSWPWFSWSSCTFPCRGCPSLPQMQKNTLLAPSNLKINYSECPNSKLHRIPNSAQFSIGTYFWTFKPN